MPHPLNLSLNRVLLVIALILLVVSALGASAVITVNYAAWALWGFVFWCASELL